MSWGDFVSSCVRCCELPGTRGIVTCCNCLSTPHETRLGISMQLSSSWPPTASTGATSGCEGSPSPGCSKPLEMGPYLWLGRTGGVHRAGRFCVASQGVPFVTVKCLVFRALVPLCVCRIHNALLVSFPPRAGLTCSSCPQFPSCHLQLIATQGCDFASSYLERKCLHLHGLRPCTPLRV